MATAHISEYKDLVKDATGKYVPVASEPAIATQAVTFTTSAQSAAFNTATKFIRVVCSEKAHFLVGANPTATVSHPYMAADSPEYFGVLYHVASGFQYKIAFYDGSS